MAAASSHAQNFVFLNKEARFIQTGPTTTVADSQAGFGFEAEIEGTAASPAPPNTFTLPNNAGTRTLTFSERDGWQFEQSFASQAALATAFPNGTYQMTFGGRTVSVPFSGDLFPAAPVATLSTGTFNNGTLVVDRNVPLTITIAFTQNYLAGSSHLGIEVNSTSGGNFGDLGASNSEDPAPFTRTPLSFTVPANTFTSGGSHVIELEANRIVTFDSTSAPGFVVVAAYSSRTRINVSVSGPPPAPVFTAQPGSQNVAARSTVVFSAAATGAAGFQWRRDGANIPGGEGGTLVLSGANVIAGDYSVVASNASGSAVSNPARLFVSSSTDFGRLINLSILTELRSSDDSFTLGYVVGGAGTAGAKPLVVRAGGPSLAALGVGDTLNNPRIELFAGSAKTGENDDWGGTVALTAAFASVGAFPYSSSSSLDAAALANITTRDNSVKVSATGGGTGTVIAEVYDATPAGTSTLATPRLLNVSVLKVIETGTSLTAGFVLRGQTGRTVLIRAIGPGLTTAFGIGGTMPDPRLTLFAGQNPIGSNDNWGGNAAISITASAIGAFAISDSNSRDAMLLRTLNSGDYSVQVSGSGGVGGLVIVEVYEVP